MNRIPLSIPEIALIGGTRAAFGAGVGLLLANRLNEDQRRAVGWTLVAVGAITTVPIVVQLLGSRQPPQVQDLHSTRKTRQEQLVQQHDLPARLSFHNVAS